MSTEKFEQYQKFGTVQYTPIPHSQMYLTSDPNTDSTEVVNLQPFGFESSSSDGYP